MGLQPLAWLGGIPLGIRQPPRGGTARLAKMIRQRETMKPTIQHYLVRTSEASFTWIGGPTKPGGPSMVWLCNPGGEPVLQVPAECVQRSTPEETARRFAENARHVARERQSGATRN